MQSRRQLADIAAGDRALFETRIRQMLELCAAGNLAAMMDHVSEDIVYEMVGNWSMFPFSQPVRGKEAFAHALGFIFTHFQSLGSDIHDIVVDGDRVAVRRTTRLRNIGTNLEDDIAVMDFVRFRDGLLVELTELVDSLAMARLEEG
jgi:ketosteroid isomerase-like protein